MKIIIPMAGRGSRFAERGYEIPKPLIQVAGRPMVAWALKSLENIRYSEIIFIALQEHDQQYNLNGVINNLVTGPTEVILLDKVTSGQLCTVLAAKSLISTDEDILIASSDTYVLSDLGTDILRRGEDCAGIISVAELPGERWSFARVDEKKRVIEVAEKARISKYASTGLYYFTNGKRFVEISEELILNHEMTRGEYYVIPVYQKYIRRGWRVDISVADEVWDMGNPKAKAAFESHLEMRGTNHA